VELTSSAGCVVVGGGVLGLSVAGALAARGQDVVVLEKGTVGSGASGLAGGIVRGFYRSEAMADVVRRSVEVFEAAPEPFGFHQAGYLAVVGERQVSDLEAIAARQAEVGYASELVTGGACAEVLTWLWPDFDASGVAAVLHERRSGWADAAATVRELARRAREAGARIHERARVTGLEWSGSEVAAVVTEHGAVRCELAVVVPGPWAREALEMLGEHPGIVSLWRAQEGDFLAPGVGLQPSAGRESPVVHLDQDGPLRADDGRVVVDGPWGIYFRLGRTGTGVVGGGLPERLPDDAPLDPYGHENPAHVAGEAFVDQFTAGLARALRRFRGMGDSWQARPGGGVLALTEDGYPVLDRVGHNAYVVLDGGAGFKLLALGGLAANDLLDGGEPLLEPFRLGRFAAGATHVASRSPYPWT
jgi:glycine/D-amino acid oxidase-like deaminating enzyme